MELFLIAFVYIEGEICDRNRQIGVPLTMISGYGTNRDTPITA